MTGTSNIDLRPIDRRYVVAAVLLTAGVLATVLGWSNSAWWWSGADDSIPRDGRSHTVTLPKRGAEYAIWSDQSLVDPSCVLTDASGREIPLELVPKNDRRFVDAFYVAKPEASFLFTAPRTGAVSATCDLLSATPGQTVELGAAPTRFWNVLSVVTFFTGPLLLLAGLVVGAVALLRPRPPQRFAAHASGGR